MIITAPDGTEVDCYVTDSGGMVDAIVRADTREAWLQAAVAAEVLESVTLNDGSTELRLVPGNHIDELGPVVITPGTYAEDGTELTPPVMDNRYHVNLRIAEPATSRLNAEGYLKWKATVLTWMQYGVNDTNPNKTEQGKILQQVCLIDPASIQTPQRAWL